jgi:hypothetical protein
VAAGDSIVSIVNTAMIALGEDPIVSLSDTTKRAILANTRYDPVRRAVLRGFPWPCAKQQANLALSTFKPLVTYDFAYTLPVDCLRFIDLPDNDRALWEVGQDASAGQLLLTNEVAPLAGVYIRDLTDPTRFDSLLVDVLALELAIDLCEPLTQSTSKIQGLTARLEAKRPIAQLTSSDEESSREWDEDIWLRARR